MEPGWTESPLSVRNRGGPKTERERMLVPAVCLRKAGLLDLFGVARVPMMARRNYLIEVRHLLLWGVFAGMFEGSVSSIVVAKTFNGGPWLITLVMASPMFANLLGLVWGTVATGRRKLPLFMMLSGGTVLMIGSVALAPLRPIGGWIFAGQIILARVLLSGCMTVRSGLWKHNYPASLRGRIAARLQLVRFSLAIATVTCVSVLFDLNPQIYTVVYPVAALIGALAVALLGRMHVRGEAAMLKRMERQRAARGAAGLQGLLGPVHSAVAVLREDRDFRRYLLAMTLLGSANIMVMPIMTIMVTKQLSLSYYHSGNLLEILPRVLMMGSLLLWAGLFDRVGVVRFRVFNGLVWVGSSVFGGLAAAVIYFKPEFLSETAPFAAAVTFVALSRLCEGLGKGGGAIAWNIGHLHFAEPARAEIYMGTHVFLTGLRGLVAPFLGTYLYLNNGPLAFIVATGLALAGALTFQSLDRRERRARDAARGPSPRHPVTGSPRSPAQHSGG